VVAPHPFHVTTETMAAKAAEQAIQAWITELAGRGPDTLPPRVTSILSRAARRARTQKAA